MTDYFTAEQVYQSLKEENAALQKFYHEAQVENETLRMGYAAARLEIESLQARIKTTQQGVARSAEPAGGYPALPSNAFNIDPGSGGNIRGYSADQMRAYADATCAMRAVQPAGALQTAPTAQTAPTPQAAPAAVAGQSAPGMQDAIRQYTEAQDALDNREYAGINAEPYDKLLRARNASRRDLEAALAAAHTPPAQAADSVLEDVVRLDWLLLHISGAEFRRIGVHYSGNARRADVDAARKQGGAA